MKSPEAIVIMGVSGCGKSTLGEALSARYGMAFFDGDDYHPAANVAKMEQGIPLDDCDRAPWLARLREEVLVPDVGGRVLACSALKRCYRDTLRQASAQLGWVFLHGDREVLLARMVSRTDHYMPADLLDSQLTTLEAPSSDEDVLTLDCADTVDTLCQKTAVHFALV